MMKKKMTMLIISLLILVICAFIGCGNKTKNKEDESKNENAAEVTVAETSDDVATDGDAVEQITVTEKVYEASTEIIVNEDGTETEIITSEDGTFTVKNGEDEVEVVVNDDNTVKVTDKNTGETKVYDSMEEAAKKTGIVTPAVTDTIKEKEDSAEIVTVSATPTPVANVTQAAGGSTAGTTNTPKPTSVPTSTVTAKATATPTPKPATATSTPTPVPTKTPAKPTATPTSAVTPTPYIVSEIYDWVCEEEKEITYVEEEIPFSIGVGSMTGIKTADYDKDLHQSFYWENSSYEDIFNHTANSSEYKFASVNDMKKAVADGTFVITRPWYEGDDYWNYLVERYHETGYTWVTAEDFKNSYPYMTDNEIFSDWISYAGDMGHTYTIRAEVIGYVKTTVPHEHIKENYVYKVVAYEYSDGSIREV